MFSVLFLLFISVFSLLVVDVFFFFSQADKYGVPRMCFVNKMDRTGANFYRAVQMIKVRPYLFSCKSWYFSRVWA